MQLLGLHSIFGRAAARAAAGHRCLKQLGQLLQHTAPSMCSWEGSCHCLLSAWTHFLYIMFTYKMQIPYSACMDIITSPAFLQLRNCNGSFGRSYFGTATAAPAAAARAGGGVQNLHVVLYILHVWYVWYVWYV